MAFDTGREEIYKFLSNFIAKEQKVRPERTKEGLQFVLEENQKTYVIKVIKKRQ